VHCTTNDHLDMGCTTEFCLPLRLHDKALVGSSTGQYCYQQMWISGSQIEIRLIPKIARATLLVGEMGATRSMSRVSLASR
jgi:hypothetical protein